MEMPCSQNFLTRFIFSVKLRASTAMGSDARSGLLEERARDAIAEG